MLTAGMFVSVVVVTFTMHIVVQMIQLCQSDTECKREKGRVACSLSSVNRATLGNHGHVYLSISAHM